MSICDCSHTLKYKGKSPTLLGMYTVLAKVSDKGGVVCSSIGIDKVE